MTTTEEPVTDDVVLRAEGLRKTFRVRGRTRGDVLAVDDVSFALRRGQCLAVAGESGCGKTTIARILVGLERPDAGSVTIEGRSLAARPRGRAARLARARAVQLVFQNPYGSLDPARSVRESLDYALALHGGGDRAERARRRDELLQRVGLGDREAAARPGALSGGQLQRAAIARALCVRPDVLVLDEAVAALDVSVQAQILAMLDDLRRELGVAYVFVSHDLAVVEAVSDELIVLRAGAVVERGETTTVLSSPEHSYTRMLLDSVPRPGWVPARS